MIDRYFILKIIIMRRGGGIDDYDDNNGESIQKSVV